MPDNESIILPLRDLWMKCYTSSWQGLLVPEAFGHPAKFSRSLIQRIYQHCAEEGWLKPSDTVLDCFGGIAAGAYDAMAAGYQWLGVELEQPFTDMSQGCDCTGISKAEWVRFHGRWERMRYAEGHYWCPRCMAQVSVITGERTATNRTWTTQPREGRPVKKRTRPFRALPFPDRKDKYRPARAVTQSLLDMNSVSYARGSGVIPHSAPHHYQGNIERWASQGLMGARLLRGDSRHLSEVLREQVACCLSSPPFGVDVSGSDTPCRRGIHEEAHRGGVTCYQYGTSEGQLAALPPGTLDACLSSPPFCNSDNRDKDRARLDRLNASMQANGKTTNTKFGASIAAGYGTHPAQLGNLPAGQVECAISSPPYANGCAHTGGADPQPAHIQGGAVQHVAYGTHPAQLGNLPAGQVECAIASPPWEDQEPSHAQGDTPSTRRLRAEPPATRGQAFLDTTYGTSPGQLGIEHGATFWEASRQILEQTFALLKPGGVAVFVTKRYVRDGAIVEFSQDWARLCQAVGFQWLHHHHALLVEEHGTQGGLDGIRADMTSETWRISFFRRLAQKKGAPVIAWEDVLCFRKPADRAGGAIAACCASPPYAGAGEVLNPHNGIDWRKTTGTGQRLTPGRAMQPYGQTEGQLGQMTPGSLDLCLSSPPFLHSDGRKGGSDLYVNNQLRRGRSPDKPYMRSHETTTPYGSDPANLGNMREGPRPSPEEPTP